MNNTGPDSDIMIELSTKKEMRYFDRLPTAVRIAVANCSLNVSPFSVSRELLRGETQESMINRLQNFN